MNAVDLHPEDLIDKLVAGELSDAETERLRAHLSVCSVCRVEIELRDDLSAESPEAFVARPPLLAPEPEQPLREPASRRPRAPLRRPLLLLAAAAILGTGGALAAVFTGAVHTPWMPDSPPISEPAPSPPAPRVAPPKRGAAPPSVEAPSPASTAIEPSDPSPLSEAAPSRTPSRAASPERRASKNGRVMGAETGIARPGSVKAAAVAEATGSTVAERPAADARFQDDKAPSANARPEAPAATSAASLFAAANRARHDGNVASAVQLYRTLERQYPSSAESRLSRALLAKLELDNGDAEAALSGFDRYLADGSPVLTAESLVGRARALEQLGKREEAAATWRVVLRRFPGSVHARLASTRLSALGMQ